MSMRLNLNDEIKVKLTEHGKDIYYHQYEQLNTAFGREICKPSYPKVDEDGYTTFNLWCFMELYGAHLDMGLPNIIEPLDIIFDTPIVEERKTGCWIPMEISSGRDSWKCSACGRRARGKIENLPYCHCGAKMEIDHETD